MKLPEPRKLKSGSWFIQLRLGGESIPVTSHDKTECLRQARHVKAEYLAGKRVKAEVIETLPTLGEAIDGYIASRTNVLSPSTIRGYQTIRDNRFKGLMSRSLSDISDSEYIVACNEEAALCAAKTLLNAWRFIATVIHTATGRPAPSITMPQVAPNERPFLEPEQVKVFVKAVAGTDVEIPALLALSSMRRSEICALKWESVDLKKRRIHVSGAAVYNSDQKLVQKKENKNRSSTRYVPIMMDELYNALKKAQQTEGFVVVCAPNTIRARINRICISCKLPAIGTHGLRHSFASLAYHLRIPEKIAMEIGGWSDNQTMRKIYTHVAKSDVSRYQTQLTNFFKQPENANENANAQK